MNQQRIKKLESLAQTVISNSLIIFLEDAEKEFGIITVTGTKISSDLSYLDVFVSCFKNEALLPKTLAKHNREIQHAFNKSVDIRKYPKIRFRYDDRGDIGQQICDTINTLDQ